MLPQNQRLVFNNQIQTRLKLNYMQFNHWEQHCGIAKTNIEHKDNGTTEPAHLINTDLLHKVMIMNKCMKTTCAYRRQKALAREREGQMSPMIIRVYFQQLI